MGDVTSVSSCWIIRNIHDTVVVEGALEVWEIWSCKNFQKYFVDFEWEKMFTCGIGAREAACQLSAMSHSFNLGWGKLLA